MRPRLALWAPWAAAAAVTALLVGTWVYLLAWHGSMIEAGLVRQIDRKTIVPLRAVDVIGLAVAATAVLGIAWRTWRRSSPVLLQEIVALLRRAPGAANARAEWRAPLASAAREVAGGGMRECEDAQQWVGHLLTMWGFLGLFATTSLDFLVNRAADPLPLLHPVRLLGNLSGTAFMAGLTLAIVRRALRAEVRAVTTLHDWAFLVALWATGATGFLVQWYADLARPQATAASYVTHLVFIGVLLATAPWTKFMHAVWRPSWVLYRALAARAARESAAAAPTASADASRP